MIRAAERDEERRQLQMHACPSCGRPRLLTRRPRANTECRKCYAESRRNKPIGIPRHFRWQPERTGPAWEAFIKWWDGQPKTDEKRRSTAWRGFHAAWKLLDPGEGR